MTNNQIKEEIIKRARLELARRDFFAYCELTASDFYKEDREYLKDLCNQLQDFYNSDEKICVINIPPRHRQIKNSRKVCGMDIGNKSK